MLACSVGAGGSGASVTAAFLGRGLETRLARGAVSDNGSGEFSGVGAVSSVMGSRQIKPVGDGGVEHIHLPGGDRFCQKTRLAISNLMHYHRPMNELIESGDPRAKVVGKRCPPAAGNEADWEQFNKLQKNFHRLWGGLPFPKGVHRFKTFEEFDEWKTNLMMRNAPGRR